MVTNRNVLYRAYDSDENLLYVGATTNLLVRLVHHEHNKSWWDAVASIRLERYETVEELMEAEKAAITSEGPRHNTLHIEAPVWAWKPRRSRGSGSLYRRASDGMWVGRVELPPGPDGKRRRKTVSSKDQETAMRKLEAIKESRE